MKQNSKFIFFALFLFFAIYLIENINDRFWLNDFKVYYSAAKALLSNEKVYGVYFGLDTGFYKYSPEILLAFVPYTIFSYQFACNMHFAMTAFSTIGSFIIIQKIISSFLFFPKESKNLILTLGLIFILNHLFRELHLGNVNMSLVFALSYGLLLILQNKQLPAGIIIAIALLVKPYLIILALPLLFHKKYKTILSIGLSVLASGILTTVLVGFSKSLSLHTDWIKAIIGHSTYLGSHHTFPALIRQYLYPDFSDNFQFLIVFLTLVIYGLIFYLYILPQLRRNNNSESQNLYLVLGYFILLSLIPNFLITDTEHFLFSLPIILILLNYLFVTKKKILILLFTLCIVLYGGISDIILGSDLAFIFESKGIIGLANIALILFVIRINYKNAINSLQNK